MTLTPQRPGGRRALPMAGHTHANRSAVTCHLRCGDACFREVPNTTETSYFRDVAASALSRRTVLGAAAVGAATVAFAPQTGGRAVAAPLTTARGRGAASRATGLAFDAIGPVATTVDDVTVPSGFRWDPIIRWGDPITARAPEFDADAQDHAAQAQQFGYNCDYLDIIVTDRKGTRALLVANHEYTNEAIMFPPTMDPEEMVRTAWAAHGLSVVELRRRHAGEPWTYDRTGRLNRRITLDTVFAVDGPAAGSDLLRTAQDPTGTRVRGTMNNCSGGTTPWGTVLSGEENFNQYFYIDPAVRTPTAEEKRYGLGAQDSRGWRAVDERWDATTNPHEPHRFGWVVEVDPEDPRSTPVKHTAMGRFKHEGANVIVNGDGRVVAYMGDDERFDYVYRFVSRDTYRAGGSRRDRAHNKTLLSAGDLSVARFTGDGLADGVSDGAGEWLPLTVDGESVVPGMTTEQVLVHTRLAADKVQPTKMDRPEDVQPNYVNGFIYVACTNNTDRGKVGKEGPTEPNPRNANKDGHVVEMMPTGGDHTAATFAWNLLLICGDAASAGTYFGGWTGPVSPISCPDNVAFDSVGNLWVSTDGQPARSEVRRPLQGPGRGCRAGPGAAVPRGADRRRDLRPGRPRPRRLGLRGRAAPGRGRHLGGPAVLLPRLRGRRRHGGSRPVRRPAAHGRAGHPPLRRRTGRHRRSRWATAGRAHTLRSAREPSATSQLMKLPTRKYSVSWWMRSCSPREEELGEPEQALGRDHDRGRGDLSGQRQRQDEDPLHRAEQPPALEAHGRRVGLDRPALVGVGGAGRGEHQAHDHVAGAELDEEGAEQQQGAVGVERGETRQPAALQPRAPRPAGLAGRTGDQHGQAQPSPEDDQRHPHRDPVGEAVGDRLAPRHDEARDHDQREHVPRSGQPGEQPHEDRDHRPGGLRHDPHRTHRVGQVGHGEPDRQHRDPAHGISLVSSWAAISAPSPSPRTRWETADGLMPRVAARSRCDAPASRPRSTDNERGDRLPTTWSRSTRAALTARSSPPGPSAPVSLLATYAVRSDRSPGRRSAAATRSMAARAAHQPGPSSTRGSSLSTSTRPRPMPWRTSASGSSARRTVSEACRASPRLAKTPWYSSPTCIRTGVGGRSSSLTRSSTAAKAACRRRRSPLERDPIRSPMRVVDVMASPR